MLASCRGLVSRLRRSHSTHAALPLRGPRGGRYVGHVGSHARMCHSPLLHEPAMERHLPFLQVADTPPTRPCLQLARQVPPAVLLVQVGVLVVTLLTSNVSGHTG